MRRPTGTPERRGQHRNVTIAVVLVVLALALIGYLVVGTGGVDDTGSAATSGQTQGEAAPEQAATGPLGDIARREGGDPTALGRTDAPVVMVAFSDYRCPFCAKFSRDTEQQLVNEYVDDGRLRIEWRDFPIFGPESTLAAQAGRAAAVQGRFWEFNKAVFADSPERAHPDLPEDKLVAYAEQVGVPDIERFRTDMHGPEAAQAVQRDLEEGSALGVPSTPAFVVNGYPVMGAQPVAEFRSQIDQALVGTP